MRSHPTVVTRPEALERVGPWPGPPEEIVTADRWVDRHGVTEPSAPSAPPVPPVRSVPPVLPVPGRHASRRDAERPVARIAGAVPAPLRGRVALGLPQLGVVAVLVALGLVVTGWWLVRSEAQSVPVAPVAPPSLESTGPDLVALSTPVAPGSPAPAETLASPDSETPTSSSVTVDVAGRVVHPRVAVLPAGSRVVDALDAAGGARDGVDLSSLNLARTLVDGEQILVGPPAAVPGAPAVPGSAPPTSIAPPASSVPTALVDLNAADQASLETLPEVGPVTALAILAWREEHGSFTAVEELLEVDGIGDATLATIAPHVTV